MADLINVSETLRRIAPVIREHFDQPHFETALFVVLPEPQHGLEADTILVAFPDKLPDPGRLVLLNTDGHLTLARWTETLALPVVATVVATIQRPR